MYFGRCTSFHATIDRLNMCLFLTGGLAKFIFKPERSVVALLQEEICKVFIKDSKK